MRLNAPFQHALSHGTIKKKGKKKKKKQKGKEYEQQLLSRACLEEQPASSHTAHIRKFPLTKVPRHFHNIELDASELRTGE